MHGHPVDQLDRARILHADQLAFQSGLQNLSAKFVAAGAIVKFLDVEILHVVMEIGDSPCNALVVPPDDARNARQRHPGGVQPRCLEVHQIPDSWNRKFQMHVIRHQRFARRGVNPGDGPGVRAWLHFRAGRQ